MNFLCLFGRHRWEPWRYTFLGYGFTKREGFRCARCRKEKDMRTIEHRSLIQIQQEVEEYRRRQAA